MKVRKLLKLVGIQFVSGALFLVLASLLCAPLAMADGRFDFLEQKTLKLKASTITDHIDEALLDAQGVLTYYKPKFDSSVKLLSPLKIYGSRKSPRIVTRVRKCILVFCETVRLEALVKIKPIKMNSKYQRCDLSWRIELNLSRSSRRVSSMYDRLRVKICLKSKNNKYSELKLIGQIRRGPKYGKGIQQKLIFDLLALQVEPLSKALIKSFKSYGIQIY